MYNILIVDDERQSSNIIKKYIETQLTDYTVSGICQSGSEAIDAFLNAPADIVLVDVIMPVMDGLTLIQELNKLSKDYVPIIISGHAEFDYAKRAMELGVVYYLVKPLDYNELSRSLDAAAHLHILRRQFLESDEDSEEAIDLPDQGIDAIRQSIETAQAYIQAHYAEDITRDHVAAKVFMSGAHFSRCFKLVTKISFKNYLTEVRIQKAIELLGTNLRVHEIARQVGYANPHRFNINFKNYTSYSPTEYRIQVLKQL